MLTDYEEKRLEYNLAFNDLNKFKKDYDNKRIEMTKRKFNSLVKEKEQKVNELKEDMDKFFDENKQGIIVPMLKNYLNIEDDYNFYNDEVIKNEDEKFFVSKKTKDDIIGEFKVLSEKVQKRYDDKIITLVIYNDLNRCLDIYQDEIISKWSSLSKKKFVEVEEAKNISKNNSTKNKKADENWFFVRIMLPIIIIDIICAIFMLFNGRKCEIGSSEALSAFLCSFTVVSNLVVTFITPIVVIYLLVKGIKVFGSRKNK